MTKRFTLIDTIVSVKFISSSVYRFGGNGGIVPPPKEQEFYDTVFTMLDQGKTKNEFDSVTSNILSEYPTIKNWMNWHLHLDRGKLISPALSSFDNSKMSKDTNAQENLGGDFKRCAPKGQLNIMETLIHAYRYLVNIQMEYNLKAAGASARYEHRKRKTKKAYENDGRAPDTTAKLLNRKPERHKQSERPKGSKNKVPKIGDLDIHTFGIPWGVRNYNGFTARNTCPLDSTLMALYLLHRFGEVTFPAEFLGTSKCNVVLDVFGEIASENYDRARLLWCTKFMGLEGKGDHDLFLTMEEVFHDHLTPLMRFEMLRPSTCCSYLCPSRYLIERKTPVNLAFKNPHAITQETLEDVLNPELEKFDCNQRMDPKVVEEMGEGMFRQEVSEVLDGDSDEVEIWLAPEACVGITNRQQRISSLCGDVLQRDKGTFLLYCLHSTRSSGV
ncbi:hypothetical protein BGZ65_007520 [Modicella reniformis]|uniref:Uncharacterized protein n=1 Tax=Modicella reniformis TaxID=1440133 RepID=A0A9P6MAY9_9FUNG|nr:hypothetical protein BGZ65_007520 [Modicella reniformis]